jgi:TetR/AcrR family fatty acid metabolism transcriptional regulator
MPKIVDKKEKKAKILEASIKVLAEKGWTKTKISDIAEAADIGKGTVYEYFRSKDEVFAASFQYFMAQVEKIVAARISSIDAPLERLFAYFYSWADIFESDYMDYLEIVLDFWAEGIRNKEGYSSVNLMDFYLKNRTVIEMLLDECIAQDKIKPVDTKIVASIIIGSLDGLMIQWIMDRNVFNLKEAVSSTARLIIDGLKKEE